MNTWLLRHKADMSLREAVLKLKEKETGDPFSRASCDFLRAIVVLHGSGWDSEVSDTMATLWSLRGDSSSDISQYHKALKKAVESLNTQRIVSSTKKKRSILSSSQPSDEILHTAVDLNILHEVLGGDRWVEKFRRDVLGYTHIRFD